MWCCCSVVSDSLQSHELKAHQTSLSFLISCSLLKLMSIQSVIPPNHLVLCHPLLLLPSVFPSIRVFSNKSALHNRWPKYWSSHISPFNGYSGLISYRIDWFNILAVQGILKSLLHHHSSKASALWHSAFFMVQVSHPYMTTGKTIALPIHNFVGKIMFLVFNMLSSLLITLLPRNKHLLISWQQSPSAVILKPPPPPQKKSLSLFPFFLHPFAMEQWSWMP